MEMIDEGLTARYTFKDVFGTIDEDKYSKGKKDSHHCPEENLEDDFIAAMENSS